MPEIMILRGYKIYFWVNEGMPLEPLHVHISKNYHHNATKIWITSTGDLIIDNNNDKIPKKELQKILKIIKSYTNEIATFWKNKFSKISYIDKIIKQNNKDSKRGR